jgi:hypothetical protein
MPAVEPVEAGLAPVPGPSNADHAAPGRHAVIATARAIVLPHEGDDGDVLPFLVDAEVSVAKDAGIESNRMESKRRADEPRSRRPRLAHKLALAKS